MKTPILFASLALVTLAGCATSSNDSRASAAGLRSAVTFCATFDHGPDADYAAGDGRLYSAPNMKHPRMGTPGLPASGVVTLAKNEGRHGHALRFQKKSSEMVFFQAAKNVDWQPKDWSGTVSFWLKLNPDEDLQPGFTDPIQITPREWNDAAFFVEFGKDEKPRHFRLGAYADFKVWNPNNREWGTIPFADKPLTSVTNPPFSREKWTHVVFTWTNFNTGRKDSVAKLFLNGEFQGALTDREQTFTWDPSKALIMLGLSYIGLWDELAIFNRALTVEEIRYLGRMENQVGKLVGGRRK